ncbi:MULTISPECIES: LysR family transcriptional regulator [Pseudomonas]|uniref:LysR family transcriptional regulator n=1 Tax=Pseudomonas putida TaxID=303 RepID=A0A1L7NCN2_PSEPU|nr:MULTISPECIES: LysR family transcriptional regulator [Pseudomonas]MBP2083443.1 DNA-binding transcriptional LysR family regulator [Pseudomonas sp. PvP089]MBP2090854.1 DNA-binding transcriptional LysR family regulator [Pseudomonas sp. PvP088]MBP2222982.1 DNA-binding transcriptional LysR family regulator [Pseudomonas putida]PMY77935.1 LysR family transcriptional regulator [Pseudomonas sp. FW306-2-2C-D06B]BAW23220.1 LysR family transcriptional regulator [Pseudomonas putida]
MFDWEDLRHFSAFTSAGSLSAAAKALGVDHATVARRIASLEASLKLKLVDRRPRAYVLTDEGRRVAELAEQMTLSSFALEHFASAGQQAVEGEVVLSAPPALLGSIVARRLGELYQRYPRLRLKLVGSKSKASLARREADISITLARPTEPTLVASLLGHLDYRLYASPGYLASAAARRYIGYDESQANSPQQQWLNRQAGQQPFALHSNDLRIQAQACAGGIGIGIACLPAFMAQEHGLKDAGSAEQTMSIEIWQAVHEDVRATPRIKAVTDFLQQQVRPLLRL